MTAKKNARKPATPSPELPAALETLLNAPKTETPTEGQLFGTAPLAVILDEVAEVPIGELPSVLVVDTLAPLVPAHVPNPVDVEVMYQSLRKLAAEVGPVMLKHREAHNNVAALYALTMGRQVRRTETCE